MSLSKPTPRKHLHSRGIAFRSYRRTDGLWDIEALMADTKTYPFANQWRGTIAVGVPLHEMLLRVTIDDQFEIRDIEAATEYSPFESCPSIAPAYKCLIGIRMGPGWRKAIRERIGGVQGCTHLTELLYPMATVAMQTLWPIQAEQRRQAPAMEPPTANRRPAVLNTCHVWSSDSPVVREHAPAWYTGDDTAGGAGE